MMTTKETHVLHRRDVVNDEKAKRTRALARACLVSSDARTRTQSIIKHYIYKSITTTVSAIAKLNSEIQITA